MKEKIDPKVWAEEFKDFLNAPEVHPPAHIREEIFRIVHRDLNPELWFVMAKLGGIHAFVGSLSLLLCSQFGVGRGLNLMHSFMSYGEFVCMASCGALFLGLTTLIAGFIFSSAELARIRKTVYVPVLFLGLASLLVFFCFGAEIAFTLALMWLVGAFLAGMVALELGFGFKHYGLRHT